MKTKPKQSRILRDMHEGARGLYKAGLLSEREMTKMDVLCEAPKPTVSNRAVVSKSVREALAKASRAVKRSMVPVSPHDATALLAALSGNGVHA